MTCTKKEFFSLRLDENIIPLQITLWNNYCAAKQNSNSLTVTQTNIPERITLYHEDNNREFADLLALISSTLAQQGEYAMPFNFANNAHLKQEIGRACSWLMAQSPALHLAMRSFIKQIVVVDCADFTGCSSIKFMGTIVLAPKNNWSFAHYIENIIHEMSHIDLYTRQIVDPFVEKNVLLTSPFRKKPRPTIAVLHAAFVLCRIVTSLISLSKEDFTKAVYLRLSENYHKLIATLQILQYAPHLTAMGELLLNDMNANALQMQQFIKGNTNNKDHYAHN